MKTMLLFPPRFAPTSPCLSLPCLTAFLQAAGHQVVQKDVNVEAYDLLLSEAELVRAYERICTEREQLWARGLAARELDQATLSGPFLIKQVEEAKRALRDPQDFYNYPTYVRSKEILQAALRLLSMAHYPTQLTFSSYEMAYSSRSTDQVLKAVRDERQNLYLDFYRRHTLPAIRAESPRVAGISITADDQIIPGLTLARLIKETLEDVHVVIGGCVFTRLQESLVKDGRLFSLFDSVVIHEGEGALLELVNRLEQGASLEGVPNLIYHDGSQVRVSQTLRVEDVRTLPTPSFTGLPLHLYFTPGLILPVYASRGCYWGRCAFCDDDFWHGARYRARGAAKVREDLEKLRQQWPQTILFSFVDEAIPPRALGHLAEEITRSGLQVEWAAQARLERRLDGILCKGLVASGCRSLSFGLESACNRVLALIDKGTDTETAKKVLVASSRAGIYNHVMILFGFPTETFDEALETIDFVLDNEANIHSLGPSHFYLSRWSRVMQAPERFGVEVLYREAEDLALTYDYQVKEGLSSRKASQVWQEFSQVVGELHPLFIAHGFHQFLYTLHYGSPDLGDIATDREASLSEQESWREGRVIRAWEKARQLKTSFDRRGAEEFGCLISHGGCNV